MKHWWQRRTEKDAPDICDNRLEKLAWAEGYNAALDAYHEYVENLRKEQV